MSQLEVYVLADFLLRLFNDRSVYEALLTGDIYSWVAKVVWPDKLANVAIKELKHHPDKSLTKLRDMGKILVLATNYLKTAQGVALSLLDETGEPASEQFCADLLSTYYTRVPGVTKWHKWSGDYAQKYGGIHSLLGRWRPIPLALSSVKWHVNKGRRQAANTPVQGSAQDIMASALLGMRDDIELVATGARPLLAVHDEYILEVPEHNAEAALARVIHCMENPQGLTMKVQLRAEAKIADNWEAGKS